MNARTGKVIRKGEAWASRIGGESGWNVRSQGAGRREAEQAFSLMELVVVMAVIAVLISLLMPALGRAKGKARNVACIGQLRQLYLAVRSYADDAGGVLPSAELLPSQPADPGQPLPRICDVLGGELGRAPGTQGSEAVFRCPEDRWGWYAREGSSYEWNTELNGRRIDEARSANVRLVKIFIGDGGDEHRFETNQVLSFPPETTPVLFDYEDAHPRPPRSGKNAVFMDGHVAPLDEMLR